MPSFRHSLCKFRASYIAALLVVPASILLPGAARHGLANAQQSGSRSQSFEPQPQETQPPASPYDKSIFLKPIPSEQLAFLNHFAGSASGDVIRDKQFRKLMHSVIPDCMFHYGRDMPLSDALDMVLKGSPLPVQIRDGRYVMVSGRSGPYLMGPGFLWIDMQEGVTLGGFYFHPTNGEPTPTVAVFSRQVQVKEKSLGMNQLPPEFGRYLSQWSEETGVPPVTTRYFITGRNKRILLEHDEDYCAPADGTDGTPPTSAAVCEQMNADAADIDMNAAYYLEQVDYATNATAWMIVGQDQIAWIQVRDETCRAGPDRLRCRIRMTRKRTQVIINRKPIPHR